MPTLENIKSKVIEVWRNDHIVLPSVTAAQFILESASGNSSLAKASNNYFGIKASAPWSGDTHTIVSNEEINGVMVPRESIFRKYATWQDSVQDHSDFFVSTETRKKVYAGIIGETDYKKACNAMTGSYATDSSYGKKLIAIIEANGLAQWDKIEEETTMDFIQFMKNNGINYRDRRGIAPYTNGSRTTGISAIAIHHSGANVDQSSEILEGYWCGTLGWGTGGYHVVIRRNAEATVEWNYDSPRVSNGVGNHNGYIFNISVEGSSNFTDRQNEVLKLVTRFWKDQLGLPYTAILGHNEFSGHYTNTCPGRNMSDFRAQINAMPAAWEAQAPAAAVKVSDPVPDVPVRLPVSYDATIKSGGFSIDSKPWGEEGTEYWGSTDDHVGKVFYFYEESYSGEYANAKGVGWIDKRAFEKEKVVVASTLFIPNGQNWVVYPEAGPYEVGEVVSIQGVEGSWYTVLGDKGNNVVVVELQSLGKRAIFADPAKGATITQTLG